MAHDQIVFLRRDNILKKKLGTVILPFVFHITMEDATLKLQYII